MINGDISPAISQMMLIDGDFTLFDVKGYDHFIDDCTGNHRR